MNIYDELYRIYYDIGLGNSIFGPLFVDLLTLFGVLFVVLIPFIIVYFIIKRCFG